MALFKRALVIVFDSLGVGELPDAGRYGDEGSHTLDNLASVAGRVRLPKIVPWVDDDWTYKSWR